MRNASTGQKRHLRRSADLGGPVAFEPLEVGLMFSCISMSATAAGV